MTGPDRSRRTLEVFERRPAAARAPGRIDPDRPQELKIRAVDLEDRLALPFPLASPGGHRQRIVVVAEWIALAVHQKVEGVPLFPDPPQSPAHIGRFGNRLGERPA